MKMNMKINKTTKVAVGSMLATLVLVGGGSWAYVSAAGATINACVAKDGDTRILLTSSACKRGEQLVSWNIMGPQGPKGDTGATGSQGLQGPKGDKGDVGIQGIHGVQGIAGNNGQDGASGQQGPKGDKGEQGVAGTGLKLVLKDRFNQFLGYYLGHNVGSTASDYLVYNKDLGVNIDVVAPNNHFSFEENSAELKTKQCNIAVNFSELNCSGAPRVQYDETCFEANSITKIGNRYFYVHAWPDHAPQGGISMSHQDVDGSCVNGNVDSAGYFFINEIQLPFTFPIRLPLRIVEE